jgi:hypothetical protein
MPWISGPRSTVASSSTATPLVSAPPVHRSSCCPLREAGLPPLAGPAWVRSSTFPTPGGHEWIVHPHGSSRPSHPRSDRTAGVRGCRHLPMLADESTAEGVGKSNGRRRHRLNRRLAVARCRRLVSFVGRVVLPHVSPRCGGRPQNGTWYFAAWVERFREGRRQRDVAGLADETRPVMPASRTWKAGCVSVRATHAPPRRSGCEQ